MHFQNSSNRIILFDTLQPEHVSVNIFILKCFYFCSGQIYLTPFSFRKNLVFWLESCLYMSVTHHGNQWDVDSCKHHYIYQVRQNVITTSVSVYFHFSPSCLCQFVHCSPVMQPCFPHVSSSVSPIVLCFSVVYFCFFVHCVFIWFALCCCFALCWNPSCCYFVFCPFDFFFFFWIPLLLYHSALFN